MNGLFFLILNFRVIFFQVLNMTEWLQFVERCKYKSLTSDQHSRRKTEKYVWNEGYKLIKIYPEKKNGLFKKKKRKPELN